MNYTADDVRKAIESIWGTEVTWLRESERFPDSDDFIHAVVKALETGPKVKPAETQIKGLTNSIESTLLLWGGGDANDGGEHDVKNMRRTLAWLLQRELDRGPK